MFFYAFLVFELRATVGWTDRWTQPIMRPMRTTGGALAANLRPLRTHLSYPACIASGNFILEFPSINSRSRLFSRWRMPLCGADDKFGCCACVNVMHAGQERWVWGGRHMQCWEMAALYLGIYI